MTTGSGPGSDDDWGSGGTPWQQPQPQQPPYQQQPYQQQPQPQQQPYQQQPYQQRPQNFLVPAILVTLFCFLPTGIAAIVFANQVNSKWGVGDFQGAQKASQNAKIWTFVSLGVGLLIGLIIIISAASSSSDSSSY